MRGLLGYQSWPRSHSSRTAANFELYRGEKAHLIDEYGAFLDAFGRNISYLFDGRLECGLREFLVPIISVHWNRVRLTPFGHLPTAFVLKN